MVFQSLKPPEAERKPSLLSSIKKHFKRLNDTTLHYSPEPATSSAELSARPQSRCRYRLCDWLMMSGGTQTHTDTKRTHPRINKTWTKTVTNNLAIHPSVVQCSSINIQRCRTFYFCFSLLHFVNDFPFYQGNILTQYLHFYLSMTFGCISV